MTWSELIHGPRNIDIIPERRDWVLVATEFSMKYHVVIHLKTYENRCGEILMIEMTHQDDIKNTVRYKKEGGTRISRYDSISSYFEHLYDKLPQVRRNRSK